MEISDRDLSALSDLAARQKDHADRANAYRSLLFAEAAELLCRDEQKTGDTDALREELALLCEKIPSLCREEVLLRLLLKPSEKKTEFSEKYTERFPDKPKICRLPGAYAKEAADLSGIAAEWFCAESFEDAVETAAGGEADGCLLPFLDENGRQMQGILRAVYESGLQKSAVYHLATALQTCTYGLFTQKTYRTEDADLAEVLIYPNSLSELSEYTSFLAKLGVACAFPSSPEGKTGGAAFEEHACRLTLRGNEEQFRRAFRGLSLLTSEMTVCGVYSEKHIGEENQNTEK